MKTIFRNLLLLACALHLSGAHWALLQVTAWTGMLVARSQSEGVVEAVKTTFDGEHPCPMCSAIESGQKDERRSDTEAPALKELTDIKLVATTTCALPAPVGNGELRWIDFSAKAPRRTDAPPTPPPLA